MRILQAVHALPPSTYGGTELYARDLAGALASAGHEVAVATPRAGGGTDGDDEEAAGTTEAAGEAERAGDAETASAAEAAGGGFEVFELPQPRLPDVQDDLGLPTGPVDPRVDERFAGLLDAFEPDVVHLQHLKGLSASLPAVCADRGVPCLLTLHDFWTICHREQLARPDGRRCSGPESVGKCTDCLLASEDGPDGVAAPGANGARGGRGSEGNSGGGHDLRSHYADVVTGRRNQLRRALATADRLIAPSAFLRDVFVDHGVPPGSISQVRNGIEVDRFDDSGYDPDAPLQVGYAGRIAPEKGVHLLLSAFESADPDGDAELHLFGEFDPTGDRYHARLAERAGELEDDHAGDHDHDHTIDNDRVRFHGRYDDRADPYHEVDVLVLPSTWYENSPLVIQEAFASGVPVVAGDVGGMAELVTDGVDGLTFESGDPGALASTIESLADDPGLLRRLRDGVEAPKRLDDHVEELLDRYAEHAAQAGDATTTVRP